MPTNSSMCFNFTFRPSIQEFEKYKDVFLDSFKTFSKNYKFIVSGEKGSSDLINHYQGFIELNKEERADKFRIKFAKKVIGSIVLAYPKVALKISPVLRDVKTCQGYILKEYTGVTDDNIVMSGYSLEYLLKVQKDYKELSLVRKIPLDKVRVNYRNLYIIYTNYTTLHTDKLKNYDKENCANIVEIIKHMVKDGYYCFDMLLNKKKLKRISFMIYDLNNLKIK